MLLRRSLKRYLDERGKQLKKKVVSPMASGYMPGELDMSPALDDAEASY